MLYLLIHGEAANLRFLPECLCFLFFCCSNALTLEPHQVDDVAALPDDDRGAPQRFSERGGSGNASYQKVVYVLRSADPTSSMPYLKDDFLECIVTPLYQLLKLEVSSLCNKIRSL